MKKSTVPVLFLSFILAITASFFAGKYIQEQEYINSRSQRCHTLIVFAIDKVENHDISDENVMKALTSNLYAAYEFCDNPNVSAQLHDLWNTLVSDGESYIGREEVLADHLRTLLEIIQGET